MGSIYVFCILKVENKTDMHAKNRSCRGSTSTYNDCQMNLLQYKIAIWSSGDFYTQAETQEFYSKQALWVCSLLALQNLVKQHALLIHIFSEGFTHILE